MENILRAIFITFIAVFGLLLNANLSTQAQSLHYLKEDLEIAVHDATLELNSDELARGRMVFDQSKAKETFKESFERNSNLTSADYEIIEMAFLDDSTVTSFPTKFTSVRDGHSANFKSPTLIVFIESKRNAYFMNDSSKTFKQVASYSYKIKKSQDGFEIPTDVIGQPNEQGFVWPSVYTNSSTSQFGMRTHPITGQQDLHAGLDIASPGIDRTQVVSAKAGTVTFANALSTYGNLIIVDHGNGLQTRYAHLSGYNVTVGQEVQQGQVIGLVGNTGGSTGPHLHFEVRINGTPYNPLIFYP